MPVARNANSLSPVAIWTLWRWIREDQVSILHSHSAKDAWISGLAARLSGNRPTIFRTRHITNPIKHRIAYSWLPDYLVVISGAMRDRFISEHRVAPGKIVLIKPSVDLRRFDSLPDRSTIRLELGFSQEDFLIGMIAEFRGGSSRGVTPLSWPALEGGNPDTSAGRYSPTLRRAPEFVSAGEDVLHAGSIPSVVSSPSVCSRFD